MMTTAVGEEFTSAISPDDTMDGRVRTELETLNQSAGDINCLEKEIDAAREKYQMTFSESSQHLETLKKKSPSSIQKARPYFELKEAARKAQLEALHSARMFQAANGVYLAAKETISLAELRLMDNRAVSLSAAWQEMLNHALVRVTDAEKEKTRTEKVHLNKAAVFADMEARLPGLEKKLKKSIGKARYYFDAKKELEIKLQQLKQTLEDLQQARHSARRRYSTSLHQLEVISNDIHQDRQKELLLMYPREPGVGAETAASSHTEEAISTKESLPSVSALETYSTDDLCCSNSDDGENKQYDFADIQNDSVFRAKILSTSLDDDDTSFMCGVSRSHKLRSRSLPLTFGNIDLKHMHSCQTKNLRHNSFLTANGMFFKQGINPDRCENVPPDGNSLSDKDNISCASVRADEEETINGKNDAL